MKCWFTLYDLHGNILSTTPEKEKITGYNISDNLKLTDIIHPDDKEKFKIWLATSQFYSSTIILRIIIKSGEILWVRVYAGEFKDKSICVLTVVLSKMHSFFYRIKKFFNKKTFNDFSLKVVVSKHKKDGMFVDLSGQFHQIMNLPIQELNKSDIYQKVIHPNDRQRVYQDSHILTSSQIPEVIFRMKKANNTYVWAKTYSSMIDKEFIYCVTIKINYFIVLINKFFK